MATPTTTIDALPPATVVTGSQLVIVQETGVTKHATVDALSTYLAGHLVIPMTAAEISALSNPFVAGLNVQSQLTDIIAQLQDTSGSGGFVVEGTLTGTSTPLPAGPDIGDVWIIGSPVPAAAPDFGGTPTPPVGGTTVTVTTMVSSDSDNSTSFGESVTFTATVTAGGTPVTVGMVSFKDGSTPIFGPTPVNSSGVVTGTGTSLAIGTHPITATYSGNATYAASTSNTINHNVISAIPPPTDWQTAVDTGNLATIQSWYSVNVGHLAQGFSAGSLWSVGGNPITDLDITAAWLTANAAAGKVVNVGGHWTITGLKCRKIRVSVSHITFDHCYLYRASLHSDPFGPAIEIFDPSKGPPQQDNVTNTDITFNYCTIEAVNDGVEGDLGGDGIYFNPATAIPNDLVFNFTKIDNMNAAFKFEKGSTANYCWVPRCAIFGADPHNTSGSIRGEHCLFYRCLMEDGSSSDISCYADLTPHTNYSVVENILHVDITHAQFEFLFPSRPNAFGGPTITNYHYLSPGFKREIIGNYFVRGAASDLQWMTKTQRNKMLDGTELFSYATDPIAHQPTVLAGFAAGDDGSQNPGTGMSTYNYTPASGSALLAFLSLGQGGHTTTPTPTLTERHPNGTLTGTTVTGTWTSVLSTAIEGAPAGLAQYGHSAHLLRQNVTGTPDFRALNVVPYTGTQLAFETIYVFEIAGGSGMTLTQPIVTSGAGHLSGFGVQLSSITSGTLASPATSGHLVCLFVALNRSAKSKITAPAGWNILANNNNIKAGVALLWRKDFTGTSVTIPSPGAPDIAVTMLAEFTGA